MTTRGIVLPLTAAQRRTRMLWLAGEATIDQLDPYIDPDDRHFAATGKIAGYENARLPIKICDIYYLLKDHNGGKDPTAIDFADRWMEPGGHAVHRTADCIGGQSWCGGFDRYQPQRFSHLYDGWINTDSMIQDARDPRKCFRLLDRPEPGCFVVFQSGSGGHKVGHIGGVTDVPAEWDDNLESWQGLRVVDMAARVGPGNRRGNPLVWFNARGVFVVSTMTP